MLRYLLLAGFALIGCVQPVSAQFVGEAVPAAPGIAGPSTDGEAARPRPDSGMGGMGGFGGMGGPMTPGNSYRVTWLPSQSVRGQATSLGVVRQDLSASCPLWMEDGDMIAARLNVRSELFDTGAILPDSRRPFPSDLWNVGLGLNGMHRFENGWTAGGMVNFGSASDHPFDKLETLNVSVMAFLRVPSGERDSWMFSLMYSPLGQLSFPLPGVAYSWNPTDEFSMNIGLPMSVRYRPTQDWTFEASYMLLTTVHTKATYRLCDCAKVYGGFEWTNEGYYVRDSVQPTYGTSYQRVRYYEKRLNTGIQYTLGRFCTFDLSGGYAFDRTYTPGSSTGLTGTDRITVSPGPYVSGQVQLRW